VEQAKQTLDQGVGFVIIDRLPLDAMSRAEATDVYWLLAKMVARPVAQKWDGRMIYNVADSGLKPGNGVRPDITNVEQNFHTDNSYNLCPPDYVALLCLQKAMAGGISRVVSFYTAHNIMLDRCPDLLARLYRPYYFDRQREHAPDDVMVVHHPLFAYDGKRLLARLSHFQVLNGQTLAQQPLDETSRTALDTLEAIMNDPTLHREFVFEPGQIQIVNNLALGHMRTGFRDWPEPERKRHLVRLWLRDRGRPFYNG
jgi:alpha-ketoglutarate-dependent taurine dioxygenase